mmetsp:Transcript_102719/g.296940  ORF Transcript_102719/g.296940 Transcript_102719/m.296940 type:complete len:233 (+) Transcript_102719:2170-2868(+)
MTTDTALAFGKILTASSDNWPLAHVFKTSYKSQSNNGRTACVSGSPKRQLNSITIGPSSVIIRPANKQPTKGLPSALMPSIVGFRMVVLMRSSISSLTVGVGAKAPMPPVFGPWSPSKIRLWSCAGGRTATRSPSVSASTEHSAPTNRRSRTSSSPAAPMAPFSRKSRTAFFASSRLSGTITPLPAARPLAFTTTSNGASSMKRSAASKLSLPLKIWHSAVGILCRFMNSLA